MRIFLILSLNLFCFSAQAVPVGHWCNGSEDCDGEALCSESVPYVWVCMPPEALSVSAERQKNILSHELSREAKALPKDILIDCTDNAGITHHGEFDINGVTDLTGFRRVYQFLTTKCIN